MAINRLAAAAVTIICKYVFLEQMSKTYYVREIKFYDALHHYDSETDPNYNCVFVSDPHQPLYPAKSRKNTNTC